MLRRLWSLLRRANRSFEAKIVAVCLLVTVAALTLTFGLFQWQDWTGDVRDAKAALVDLGMDIAPMAAKGAAGDTIELRAARAAATSAQQTSSAVWFPADGSAGIVLNGPAEAQLRPRRADSPVAIYDGASVRAWVPFREGRRLKGELALEATDEDISRKLIRNTVFAALLGLGATAVSGMVARTLARRALGPMRALDGGIAAVQEHWDLARRLPVTTGDEFGRLTSRFNGLLGHLESYDLRLKGSLAELTTARDEAQEATVMKSQFLANMSHEIRTPLNGVLAMAQVMDQGALNAVQRQRLKVIRESGESLLTVLNDLLDLSKIEAGRLELDPAPFDIEEVTASVRGVFGSLAERKRLSAEFTVTADARGVWLGDAGRVRQVLFNLVSNAVKFTEKGAVCVTWSASGSPDRRHLVLEVRDTGIGIAPDALPKLFDKFVQADASITRRFGGSGLGLTICRELVELMGGAIDAKSKPGTGTTFRVVLPLRWLGARQPASDQRAPEPAPADISGLRILAAEDNATNRIVLQTVLGAMGLPLHMVENGREAVDAWRHGDFDLVLMDIQMPVLDGVRAAREIRALEAQTGRTRTAIIALSANAMKHQVDSYRAAGMDGHIAKPIEIHKLHAVLADVAARSKAPTRADELLEPEAMTI